VGQSWHAVSSMNRALRECLWTVQALARSSPYTGLEQMGGADREADHGGIRTPGPRAWRSANATGSDEEFLLQVRRVVFLPSARRGNLQRKLDLVFVPVIDAPVLCAVTTPEQAAKVRRFQFVEALFETGRPLVVVDDRGQFRAKWHFTVLMLTPWSG